MTAPLTFVTAADVDTIAFDDYLESLGVPGGAEYEPDFEPDFSDDVAEARWDRYWDRQAGAL